MDSKKYETPAIVDFGTLLDLTASTGYRGPEDGGSKLLELPPHHSGPLT